jgi:murein DD-endopeptidase MepM/ murein hydrolase activator NlpD
MKSPGLIIYIILLTSFVSFNSKYSRPYHQSDYIKIQRKFGWHFNTAIFSKPFDYKGVVIELKENATILSIQEGKVIDICDSCVESEFGNYITIKNDGEMAAKYYHLSILKVKNGQSIKKAEEIGISGNTGLTTVNCVGIQIEKKRKIIDPMNIIKEE